MLMCLARYLLCCGCYPLNPKRSTMKTKLVLVMALSVVGLFASASFAQEDESAEPQVAVEKQAAPSEAVKQKADKEERRAEKQVMKEDRKAERDFQKEQRKVEKEQRRSEKER